MLGSLTLTALKVLILAGGGSAEENHHSHLVHVQALDQLLQARGVDARDITVFWADGTAPGPDRGIVDEAPLAGEHLIEGTVLDAPTASGSRLENTVFPGRDVRPATRAALSAWLATIGPTLTPEDTVFVAVTDHGEPDPAGGRETAITLWNDRWTVSQMQADLSPVPATTRVVLMMSQCYSGGFSELARRRPNLCGSFSTHADRLAYGCYPHLAIQEDIGHFMHVTRALARSGAIGPATDVAMVTDDSPDVPHLSSDAYLFDALTDAFSEGGGDIQGYIDGYLTRQWDHPDWQRLSRLSLRYGVGMIENYGAALRLWDQANAALDALTTWTDRWTRLHTQARDRIARPVAEGLSLKTDAVAPQKLAAAERRRRRKARAKAIERYERALATDPQTAEHIAALASRVRRSATLMGQLEQQEAALVRAMYLLGRRAGLEAMPIEVQARYAALRSCEEKPLFPGDDRAPMRGLDGSPLLAPLTTNMSAVTSLTPGFLGIGYRDAEDGKGVSVDQLVAGGPAAATPLRLGNEIVRVDRWTLTHPEMFRSAASLATPGTTIHLEIRNGAGLSTIPLTVGATPLPPRPPAVGDWVPPLRLTPFDVEQPLPILGQGAPMALFFWTTKCAPCKAALPSLAGWARRQGAKVIAITGETQSDVKAYVEGRTALFPFPIALDAEGEASRLFDVRETPTFVFVDPTGRVVKVVKGFDETGAAEWSTGAERP